MCIGIPMRVVEEGHPLAWCAGRGERKQVDMLLTGRHPLGTWVLEFRGVAQRVLGEDEAKETNAALDALEAVMRGESDVDAYFTDLAGRDPELPVHLRGVKS
jgi:hydrogenase expression/formation protein HypC